MEGRQLPKGRSTLFCLYNSSYSIHNSYHMHMSFDIDF